MLTSTSIGAELFLDACGRLEDGVPVCHIEWVELGTRADPRQLVDRRRTGLGVDVGEGDPRALGGEGTRDRAADTRRAAGEKHHLVLKSVSNTRPFDILPGASIATV